MDEQLMTELAMKALPAISSTGALALLGWILWLRQSDKRNGRSSGDHDAIVRLQEQSVSIAEDVKELKTDMKMVLVTMAKLVNR